MDEPLIAGVDVDYRGEVAVAAGVWFRGWSASRPEVEATVVHRDVLPYHPGEFYRRELPCLLDVLGHGPPAEIVVVDGYAWLGPGRPGLGAHLHAALGGRVIVVGVAKTRFAGADAVEVCRGGSRSPLFVTAAGCVAEEAALGLAGMHGPYREPTLLKRVDQLARRLVIDV